MPLVRDLYLVSVCVHLLSALAVVLVRGLD